ncbi:MAG: hypothetical protein ACFFA6_08955 [Promethearchaeota archaeon]
MIISPHIEEGKNQTPITNTTAYIRANNDVIANPDANLSPIIYHLQI